MEKKAYSANYRLGQMIGQGVSGHVYEELDAFGNGSALCVKVIDSHNLFTENEKKLQDLLPVSIVSSRLEHLKEEAYGEVETMGLLCESENVVRLF